MKGKTILSWWNFLAKTGVTFDKHRQINLLNNKANMAIVLLLLVGIGVNSYSTGSFILIQNTELLLIIFVSLGSIILNYFGWFQITRYVLVFVPIFILTILSVIMFGVEQHYFFWHPFAPICVIVLTVLFVDPSHSPKAYYLSLAYAFILSVGSYDVLVHFSNEDVLTAAVIANETYFRFVPMILAISILFFVKELNAQFRINEHRKNYQIEIQKSKQAEYTAMKNAVLKHEKMAMIGRISSEITHEINTPLAAIKGNLSMMVQEKKLINQMWEAIMDEIDPLIHKSLLKMISDAIEHGSRKLKYERSGKNDTAAIHNKLNELTIPKERHQKIAEYMDEIGLSVRDEYSPILMHRQFELMLEIVYCEQGANHAAAISKGAIERAEMLIKRMKRYTEIQGFVERKPYQLELVVKNTLEMLQVQLMDINVQLQVKSPLPLLFGYADEIQQVVTNLIMNAVQAMQNKGDLFVDIWPKNDGIMLSIEDTGGGIHLAPGEDIFQPFFTTKTDGHGSGLGLNICQKIIDNHQGTITWYNADMGARFIISLPATVILN